MKHCLFIFCILVAAHVVAADDPYKCAPTQTINPPTNINTTWAYPTNWNNTNSAPQYAANQNCIWIVNVPKGLYAMLQVKSNYNNTSVLTVTDSTGYVDTIQVANNEPYFLLDPSFKVELQANQGGFMGMTVLWFQVNTNIYPSTYKVHQSSSPIPLFGGDFDNSTVVQADTQVSVLAFPPSTTLLDLTPFMRLTQVYDGDSVNAKHVGNLYQIMNSGKNFVSSGKSLTLFSLFPGMNLQNLVIFQDFADVKQYKSYQGIYCIVPNICETSMNATEGTAAAIRFWPTFYVTSIGLQDNNKLSVYNGYVGSARQLADYTKNTSKTDLPQKFSGKFTVFVLDQGIATIRYSGDAQNAKWGTGFDGRRGFVTSPNYGMQSSDQAFGDQILTASTSDVTYFFDSSALLGDAILNVVIWDGQKTAVNNTYTSSRIVDGVVKAPGTGILVKYQPNGAVTSGSYVRFKFEHHNAAVAHGVLLAVGMTIWRMLSV